jgi:exopolysaccharide biosynthesis protein
VLLRADGRAQAALAGLRLGDQVRLEVRTPELEDGVTMAAGGNFIILRDGQIPFSPKPTDPRHPRTMIGFNDREIIIVTVDGRQPQWSVGMTYHEQAQLMQRLGCTDALNLDGGGSTTCWVGGKVVNQPSGGMERRIANAILIRSAAGP